MSNKVPQIRFNGYSDAWEERKLKDVTERVRSNDGRMDLPTLTMSASSGWLDQKDRFSGDISGQEKKNYTLLKKGELSYNHGNSKLAKYGVVFSLTNYEEALVPRVYHSFKALENTSADFIEYMFSTKIPDRELGKLVSSGARMDGLLNINYDDFMNIHISIPNYEEQILMSDFFRKLDDTIALHQRKLDLLKEQKKGFLQKMFPKNGAKVPELRFAGFTDDWEERKFKDILKTYSFRSYLANASDNGKYEVIQQGDNPIVGYSDGIPFMNYKDIILFGDHTVSLYKPHSPFFISTDGVKILSADNFEGIYLYTTLERYKPDSQGYKRHFTILKNQELWFTRNMEEQQKVGLFFKQLDNNITLQQKKLSLLKDQKKGLLQKMFI
ncbi:restriction endonuclease subunit S [Leuconostoc suionicum]|uniref:restriction endonuclease subunit S n=1 Tax=Leuconostoc suionicum TaxID=1511761 RepID=UPI001B8C2000|nr:restriction endonuclease subunit S [Leuconostoc suionicum]MBS1008141.1 restriction endonuclease subunit S [Leuconostoc suionicum]